MSKESDELIAALDNYYDRPKFVADLGSSILLKENGEYNLVQNALDKLRNVYFSELIEFDSNFCEKFSNRIITNVAAQLGRVRGNLVKYEPKLTKPFSVSGKDIIFRLKSARLAIPERSNAEIYIGRTSITSELYFIEVDHYQNTPDLPEYNVLLAKYNEEHPHYVDAALIIDSRESSEGYNKARLFAQDSNEVPEFTTQFGLERLVSKLIPKKPGGNKPITII